MNDSTKKLEELFNARDSENEDQQEIVPFENDSDFSQDDIRPKIRARPNIAKSSALMKETLGSFKKTHNSLRIEPNYFGKTTNVEFPLYTLGADELGLNVNEYDLTPEIHKTLSWTGYPGRSMKNDGGILMMNIIKNGLGYTANGDETSELKIVSIDLI